MVLNFLWTRNPLEVPSFALESGTGGSINQNPLPATGPGFALGPCYHSLLWAALSSPGTAISQFTGPLFDGYWVVSVLSPVLFILLVVKATLMIINDELFRRFFVIHTLAVIAFIITVIVLCFVGYLLVLQRITIQTLNQSSQSPPDYINALFAGPLLEVLFLGGAWICHILAHLFGGAETNKV